MDCLVGVQDKRGYHVEVGFLGILVISSSLYLVRQGLDLSGRVTQSYKVHGILPSPYFLGQQADMTDIQIRLFLSNLEFLFWFAFFYLIFSKFIKYSKSLNLTLLFHLVLGLIFAIYVHGAGSFFLISSVLINYLFINFLAGKKIFPGIFWTFNIFLLFLSERFKNFYFSVIWDELEFLDLFQFIIRWQVSGKFLFLRIISFGMDYHWMVNGSTTRIYQEHLEKCFKCSFDRTCSRFRRDGNAKVYSFVGFLAYCFYSPLFVAGPVVTFNDWMSQKVEIEKKSSKNKIILIIFRFLVTFLLLLFFMHYFCFSALSNNAKNLSIVETFKTNEILIASFFNFLWVWLKFSVILQFFRIWAFLDEIKATDDFSGFIFEIFSLHGFCMFWFRSFRKWIKRYLVNPLKGQGKSEMLIISCLIGLLVIWNDFPLNLTALVIASSFLIFCEEKFEKIFSNFKVRLHFKPITFSLIISIGKAFYICTVLSSLIVCYFFGGAGLYIFFTGLFEIQSWPYQTFAILGTVSCIQFSRSIQERFKTNKLKP